MLTCLKISKLVCKYNGCVRFTYCNSSHVGIRLYGDQAVGRQVVGDQVVEGHVVWGSGCGDQVEWPNGDQVVEGHVV